MLSSFTSAGYVQLSETEVAWIKAFPPPEQPNHNAWAPIQLSLEELSEIRREYGDGSQVEEWSKDEDELSRDEDDALTDQNETSTDEDADQHADTSIGRQVLTEDNEADVEDKDCLNNVEQTVREEQVKDEPAEKFPQEEESPMDNAAEGTKEDGRGNRGCPGLRVALELVGLVALVALSLATFHLMYRQG